MLKITHACGFEKEIEFLCPKCNKPFCEEDSQQAQGGAIVGHYTNNLRISQLNDEIIKLQEINKVFQLRLDQLEKIVFNCKQCMKKPNIEPIAIEIQ